MKKVSLTLLAVVVLLMSVLLVSCEETQLAAPANIQYDGIHITWNAVENAGSYSVKINNGEAVSTSEPRYAYDAAGNEFTVVITAESAAKSIIASGETSMTFKPLGSVSEIRIADDGAASWDVVNMATGYKIRVDGVEVNTVLTTPSYSDIAAGTHSIQVKAVIDGDNSYYSSWSAPKSITILETITKDDITYADGYIKWKYVNGAQYYSVMVNGVVVSEKCQGTQVAYDHQSLNFEVSVKAIGNHSTTYDSAFSDARKFVFLDTVTSVNVQDGVLIWDAINGADGYKIKLNGNLYAQTLTEPKFDKLNANVATDIQIMPISNDAAYFSNWSSVKSVLLLAAPTLQWNADYELDGQENQNVYWDGIANAEGYTVRLTSPDGTVQEFPYGSTQRSYANAYIQVGTYKVEVKSNANSNSSNTFDSMYSKPINIIRLAAPTPTGTNYITSDPNDLSKGFTVTFSQVTGATSYRLYRDNQEIKTGTTNQFAIGDLETNSIEEQHYTYKIRAIGGVKNVNGEIVATLGSLSSASMSFDITVLATPALTAPAISGFTYSFGAVNNSFGYVIDVGGKSYTSDSTTYDLSILESGNYDVSVCARGNGANVLASDYTAAIAVHRLEAPTNVRIDTTESSQGVLTFDPVQHASGYVVVFNNDGNPIPAETIQNMNQYITEQGTTVYMQSSANYFNAEGTIYYMTSRPGTTTNFIKLSAPTFGDAPFTNTQLLWNAPANINTQIHTPTYRVYDPSGLAYNGEKNGTAMDISTLAGGTSYTFQVQAIGNGTTYINSDLSTPVSIYKLRTPEIQRANGKYTWASVANAVSYKVLVDGVEMNNSIHEAGTTYEFTPNFTELKTYKVEVIAVGDGGYTSIDSAPAEIEQKTKQLTTPEITTSYSEEAYSTTGNIIVTITKQPEYAIGYYYTVAGVTKNSPEITFSHNTNSVGEFTVTVYAQGGGFDAEGTYYLDSQSTAPKTITVLTAPNSDSIVVNRDGLVTWPASKGTSKYEIRYDNGAGFSEWIAVNNAVTYEIVGFDVNTPWTIEIRAIGNGTTTITSEVASRSSN